MTILTAIFDAVSAPESYVATWRDGEIYIEPAAASFR